MTRISKQPVNWTSNLGPATPEQAERAATMSFVFLHIALMSDALLR